MPKYVDLTGQRFERLVVVRYVKSEKGHTFWECKCDCGNVVVTRRQALRTGDSKSCGCYNSDKQKTHGMEGTRFYKSWALMKARCYDPKKDSYHLYGGRGIKVCERWKDSFQTFKDDMYDTYKEHLTLDRIDVNGDYEPSNCRWLTAKEQSNNKTNNRYIEIDGETKTLTQWCEIYNANYFNVWALIKRGHKPKYALEKHSKK